MQLTKELFVIPYEEKVCKIFIIKELKGVHKMKHTISPDGRNHSMPRCMHDFFWDLESLAGVEAVNSGRFIRRNRVNGFEVNIQFYDETKRTFCLKVAYKRFISYPEVIVSAGAREEFEDYIRNYKINGSAAKNLQGTLQGVSQEASQEACYELNQTAMAGV